jgi:hypothetical protein
MVSQGFLQNRIDARIESMAYFVTDHGYNNKQFGVMSSEKSILNWSDSMEEDNMSDEKKEG